MYSPLEFFSHFTLSVSDDDYRNVKEVIDSKDNDIWKKDMVEEMGALDKNETWDLVYLLARRKTVGRKWLFKKKINAKSKVETFKSFLIEKGYS